MAMKLKIGDRVTIYVDPFTRKEKEEDAILVGPLQQEGEHNMERWLVRFLSEPETEYARWIYTGDDE
jgi:hypothetical protein